MNETGRGFAYADQKAAEEQVHILREAYARLVDNLEALNKEVDSLRLQRLIEQAKFERGLS